MFYNVFYQPFLYFVPNFRLFSFDSMLEISTLDVICRVESVGIEAAPMKYNTNLLHLEQDINIFY